ncbi:SDR family NAD(P)-dependent oxidoreductase [Solirubrobacter ginsenosidimutans]|uniref:SDR family NAD(P)-dependent oxidoreductase n=1 Tax=Solirubrobacter ginsenosidimutans TaxID=490573 RepID=A0A9X3S4V7_9ACTN|nr:SDR family NAD(P)-dependent oxidoreductase [Solirubrobacter ginsenosidimutans]MDA0161008.1 SDR family NAD(P)-dependent oxidoreductase [Solirubrobacter ginsenosidimutans]
MSTFLVIGGTGKTGRRVVERLNGHDARIATRATGFDWAEPEYDLTGIDGVFLTVPGQDPRNAERVAALLNRFEGRAVLLSARAVEFHPDGALAAVERAARGHTILRPSWFVQNFTEGFLQPDDDGVVTAPTGEGREPFVDLDDVADVAVAALTQPGHEGVTYELSGPTAITFAEAAQRVGGTFVPADPATYAASLDLPAEYVAWRMAMFDAIREGRDARVSRGVDDALGRPPRAFSQPAGLRKQAASGVATRKLKLSSR